MQRCPAEPNAAETAASAACAEIGVRQHHHVVLGPAERLHALAGLRRLGIDLARDRCRAHEADRLHVRVIEQRVDRERIALHHVQYAGRHTRLRRHLREQQRGGGIALGGLEHERVAAHQRDRNHPQRHHRREVERRHPDADAKRLTHRVDVHAARHLLGMLALEDARRRARKLNHLQPPLDFAPGIVERLSVLAGDRARQFLSARDQRLAKAEHHTHAAGERGLAPARERACRRLHGQPHGACVSQQHPAARRPPRWIEHLSAAGALRRERGAVDPVADLRKRRTIGGRRRRRCGVLPPHVFDVRSALVRRRLAGWLAGVRGPHLI